MPSGAATRARIVSAACRLFYEKGFARVSVDEIAEAASTTKRTFYNHFESKDEISAAALEAQHAMMLREITSWGIEQVGNPEEFCRLLFLRLGQWAAEDHWTGSGFTRMTMELADLPGHPARNAARVHKVRVESILEDRFRTMGMGSPIVAARRTMLLVEGAMSLTLIHGDATYIREAGLAAAQLASDTRVRANS